MEDAMKPGTYAKFTRDIPVRALFNGSAWPESAAGARQFFYEAVEARIDRGFVPNPVRVEGVDMASEGKDFRVFVSGKVFKRDLREVYPGFTPAEIGELKADLCKAGFAISETTVMDFRRQPR
jgi:hypothetical protein